MTDRTHIVLDTRDQLDRFFAACDEQEDGQGREPDWDEHLRVIRSSMAKGSSDT
jgi:hypothetical protein